MSRNLLLTAHCSLLTLTFTMLVLENVSVNYDAIEALTDISLTVNQGEVVTLIGANGAGKSTTCLLYTSDAADE